MGTRRKKTKLPNGQAQWKCHTCNTNEQEVECDWCAKWVCWQCSKVEEEHKVHVEETEAIDGLMWMCEGCTGEAVEKKDVVKLMREKMAEELADHRAKIENENETTILRDEIERVRAQGKEWEERCKSLEEQLKEQEIQKANDKNGTNMKEFDDMKKTLDSKVKKKERECENMKEEIQQYKVKLGETREEEKYQKDVNKVLLDQIEAVKRVNRTLEEALGKITKRSMPSRTRPLNKNEKRGEESEHNGTESEIENANDKVKQTGSKHVEDDSRRLTQKVCENFAYGKFCRYGTKCKFVHQKICRNMAEHGECDFGEQCRYSHDLSRKCRREESEEGCPYGNRCYYGHTKTVSKDQQRRRNVLQEDEEGRGNNQRRENAVTREEEMRHQSWATEMIEMRKDMTKELTQEMNKQVAFLVNRMTEQTQRHAEQQQIQQSVQQPAQQMIQQPAQQVMQQPAHQQGVWQNQQNTSMPHAVSGQEMQQYYR